VLPQLAKLLAAVYVPLLPESQPCYFPLTFLCKGETLTARNFLLSLGVVCFSLICSACAAHIPTVSDDRLERLVREEAFKILQVTRDRAAASRYQFLLSDFPRKDLFGLTSGNRRIYISYDLARHAANHAGYRWQLRQTLAHEIAHELSGHADSGNETSVNASAGSQGLTGPDLGLPGHIRFDAYSMEKELEADLNGIKYWNALGWDCRIWVDLLEAFVTLKYAGDSHHPTDLRLAQALKACPSVRRTIPLASLGSTNNRQ
jgi:predicted Zn-dependent protease